MAKKKQDNPASQAPAVHDPYADREAQNYENPIPSREYILEYMAESGEPVSYPQLCDLLGLEEYEQMEALRRRLIAMSRDGQLISNRRGVYGLPDRMELLKGRVQGSKDGFGFFIPNDASGDLFLGPNEMQKVFDGDIVLARVSGLDRRGRKEGMIVEVLERRSNQIVGRYYWEQGFGVVVPDNRRNNQEIMVPEGETRGAKDGQFVVAEITTWPTLRRKPVAKIVEILGDHMTPGMEIDVAVRSHDIPYKWPREVTQSLKAFSNEVPAEDSARRIDLRQLPFVTIDGEDAKDFDDAVYCEALPNGEFKLSVAIADVSHYVQPGSPLDLEAQNRGNSVYFPGHVIPMLPEALSNGLCSLKPEVDRLVMVCEMRMDALAKVTDFNFFEGVIHSHARLTYTEVSEMLEAQENATQKRSQERLRKRYAGVLPHLENLYALYKKMARARELAGALEFASTETRIIFGETRKIREIVPVVRNDAHRLIEECMLAANVCTARFLEQSGLPILYRVHEGPNMDKLDNLRAFLKELGLSLGRSGKPEPKDYQRVLQKTADRPDAHLIQVMLVRSMLQAVYQPDNIGHFGLGFDAYTHFTSPIRRYPDLLVHRALRYLVRSKDQKKNVRKADKAQALAKKDIFPYQLADMQRFGEICSMTERRADAASYDVVDWLKCEYIQDRVGDEFAGTISSVTGFGLFVQLNDIYVEGLVHITALSNDYYQFDPVRQVLRGERSGITYNMGGAVQVKVVRVDLDDRKIDLQLVEPGREPGNPDGRPAKRNKGSKNDKGGKGSRNQKSGKSAKSTAAPASTNLRKKLAKGEIPTDIPPKAARTKNRAKPGTTRSDAGSSTEVSVTRAKRRTGKSGAATTAPKKPAATKPKRRSASTKPAKKK